MNINDVILSIGENLKLITEFVDSDEYTYICSSEGKKDIEIARWINEFNLHHASFNFFFDMDPVSVRTLYESHTLATRVINFLSHE